MAEPFLVFTLAAPMASFGVGAGNAMRGSQDAPGHSLIVGMMGAALGIEREDPRLLELSDGALCAVAMEARGAPLRDFHTVQSRHERKGPRPATRREALAEADPYTTVTERDYVTDVVASVAVARRGGPFSLEEISAALTRPRFTLWLGRKSCPLALPLAPAIVTADDAAEALRMCREARAARGDCFEVKPRATAVIARAELYPDQRIAQRRQSRRTLPASRSAWSYRLLDELVLASPSGELL